MTIAEIGSKAIINRIIEILQAADGTNGLPDLRLSDASTSHVIKKYIFGTPDENELTGQTPVIAVKAGGLSGDFIDDAGDANSTQIGHLFTATIIAYVRNNNAQASEQAAHDLFDDIWLVLRNSPDLRKPSDGSDALVQKDKFAWSGSIISTQADDGADFTTEIAIVARWHKFLDV